MRQNVSRTDVLCDVSSVVESLVMLSSLCAESVSSQVPSAASSSSSPGRIRVPCSPWPRPISPGLTAATSFAAGELGRGQTFGSARYSCGARARRTVDFERGSACIETSMHASFGKPAFKLL